MTLKERILAELENGPMSDRELTDKLLGMTARQQSINQACRQLAEKGIIMRTTPPIVNILVVTEHVSPIIKAEQISPLSEEAAKRILNDHFL